MKCLNCGSEIPKGNAFCGKCGWQVEAEYVNPKPRPQDDSAADLSEQPPTAGDTSYGGPYDGGYGGPYDGGYDSPYDGANNPPAKSYNKIIAIAIIAVAAVVAVVALVFGAVSLASFIKSSMPLSDEEAAPLITEVADKLEDHDYDAAEQVLDGLKLKEGSKYAATVEEFREIADMKPEVVSTNTDSYPSIEIVMETDNSDIEYTQEDFKLLDRYDEEVTIDSFKVDGNKYTITYTTAENDDGEDIEESLSFLRYVTIDFYLPVTYVSKHITQVDISYITSNVEDYPEMSLYLRVVDENGEPVEGLDENSFVIKESLDIDDFIERDVIYAAKIDGQDALNVSLAIDRSHSIDDSDMYKIKNATNTFLSKLQFDAGDKAEIVSFDTNVMQMCLFTNNKANLMNGVNSMFPYGTTACYDAIVRSIQNASVQSGARCVIVFTDGLDNESVNTVDSVIRLARSKSVPVYTIGVGNSLDVTALRRIAESTGGTYHHIDDVSAMSRVYEEIYREQKSLYHIKCISDKAIAKDAERRIVINVSGNCCIGEYETVYTPIVPIKVTTHSSRYEVIKADVSWEEANRLCINKGGHLATITSRAEEQKIIALAEKVGIDNVWIGGYTTNDRYGDSVGHWVMGEPFIYQNWYPGEPSRFDSSDNEQEFYLMLWKIKNVWSWNDERNDLINSQFAGAYKGKMGYVIEYEY